MPPAKAGQKKSQAYSISGQIVRACVNNRRNPYKSIKKEKDKDPKPLIK